MKKKILIYVLFLAATVIAQGHEYNGTYTGDYLNRVAFPIGGIGAGMICLEGTGAISHVSVRNNPDIHNEPLIFSTICVKGETNVARVLEGPIPTRKILGRLEAGNGLGGTSYGFPRFDNASFRARFPFGIVKLTDREIPLEVELTGWSPFIPGDADNSSLPVGMFEYRFKNPTQQKIEAMYSNHSSNFMQILIPNEWGGYPEVGHSIKTTRNGFVLWQDTLKSKPYHEGGLALWVDDPNVVVDYCWFRGGWFDPLTILWKNVQEANLVQNVPIEKGASGASIYVPFELDPNEEKVIRLQFCWYVPKSDLRLGEDPKDAQVCNSTDSNCYSSTTYVPWYAG
jgi:hypothetical protein